MGTSTTNYGFYKPDVDETGWGATHNTATDSADAAIASAVAGAGGGTSMQADYVQYVLPSAAGGSDTNDGRTPATAKASIEGAAAQLRTGFPNRGGIIYLLPSGSNHAAGQTVTTAGVTIRGASREAVRIRVGAADSFGVKFDTGADYSTLENVRLEPVSQADDVGGVLIHRAEALALRDVSCFGFGFGIDFDTVFDADAGPYAIKVRSDSTAAYSDWHELHGCHIWQCFRGFVAPGGGTNGKWMGGTIRGSGQSAVVLRSALLDGGTGPSSAAWWFFGLYAAGVGRNTVDNWLINNDAGGTIWSGCEFELNPNAADLASTGAAGHVRTSSNNGQYVGCQFLGGATGAGGAPTAMRFETGAAGNIVGPYYRIGSGFGLPAFTAQDATAASNNYVWQSSDYSFTVPVA